MAAKDEKQVRRVLCEVGRRLYERGWAPATDGSMSCRLSDESCMFTPDGCSLGGLQPDQMVLTDAAGVPGRQDQTPTSEWSLHLVCYGRRPDVRALIHAHLPWVLSACATGLSLARPVLPEVVFHLGAIPTAAYAPAAGQEADEAVGELVSVHDAVALDRRGLLAVDQTLEGAFMKLERAELSARVIVTSAPLGVLRVLPRDQVEKLRQLRAQHGLNPLAVLDDPSWSPGRPDWQALQ